jgi:hypothetical protein
MCSARPIIINKFRLYALRADVVIAGTAVVLVQFPAFRVLSQVHTRPINNERVIL